MNIRQIIAGALFFLFSLSAQAQTTPKKITVTGKLTRMMAIGGESTGWAVQFDARTSVEDKPEGSIEVKFSDPKLAEKYVDKRVKVTGTIAHRHGVENGNVVVLEVISIKSAKPTS